MEVNNEEKVDGGETVVLPTSTHMIRIPDLNVRHEMYDILHVCVYIYIL